MSLNEQLLRRSLDIYDNEQGGLLDAEGYRQKIDQFNGASFIGYINFDGLPEFVNKIMQTSFGAGEVTPMIDHEQINGYRSGVFGAWREENAIVDKAVISFDPESMNERSHKLISSELAIPDSYSRVAGDTIIYHWTNQFNAETLLRMLAKDSKRAGGIDNDGFIDQLSEITSLSADQLFNLFDNDLTLAVRKIEKNQLVPLPRFLISFKSSNIEMLKTAINELPRRKQRGINI